MILATQISVVPFLLRGPFNPDRTAYCLSEKKELGQQVILDDKCAVEDGLLGDGFLCYKLATTQELLIRALVGEFGLGVITVCWPTVYLQSDPRALPEIRRTRHLSLLSADTYIGSKCVLIAKGIRSAVNPYIEFPKWFLSDKPTFSYVFSFWRLDGKNTNFLQETQDALLVPSLYRVSDTSWETPCESPFAIERGSHDIADIDISPHVVAKASWASLVLSGDVDDEVTLFYSAIEVRLQALWMYAHSIAQTRPNVKGLSLSTAELMSGLFNRAIGGLSGIDDPMASERTLLIHRELVRTSQLNRVVQDAKDNITTLNAMGSSRSARRRTQSEGMSELLLFVIASLQIVPLIVNVPLSGGLREILYWGWPAMFVLFLLMILIRRR